MKGIIPVENGDTLGALQRFLRALLEQGVVQALLVPMRTPNGAVTPALLSDPDLITAVDPLAPVMPGNAAILAGKLSIHEPRAKIGAVLRSCELRALIELVKLQQASTADLTLIALDCAGTYEVVTYQNHRAQGSGDTWRELYRHAATHPEQPLPDLRLACRMCERPIHDGSDITVELLSSDLDQSIHVSLSDELGEKLSLARTESSGRAEVIEKLVAARTVVRDAEFAAIRQRLEGDENLIGVFDACIRCHNCMTVCPVCYCKTCVFKSAVFDHGPMQFVRWANQKGAYRLPADTSLFHLTRLNHMGLSCVGCGMCTQACPAELPVGTVFRAIGQRLQDAFEYVPGRSLEEPLPLVTFKENEWTDLGE